MEKSSNHSTKNKSKTMQVKLPLDIIVEEAEKHDMKCVSSIYYGFILSNHPVQKVNVEKIFLVSKNIKFKKQTLS